MKTQLEKIRKIAIEFVKYGKEIRLNQTYNNIENDITPLSIYFMDDYMTQSVNFEGITVCFYSNKFDISFDQDEKTLKVLYEKLQLLLKTLWEDSSELSQIAKLTTENERKERVKKLEKELEILKKEK